MNKKQQLHTQREVANRHLDVSPARMQLNASQTHSFSANGKSQVMESPRKHQLANEAAVSKKARGVGIRVQSLQTDFEESEICQVHVGEPNIAMDSQQNDIFGCNKCVFARKLKKPIFLAGTAKKTKARIDGKYEQLTKQLDQIDELQPGVFVNKLQKQVSDFFQTIYKTIKDVEREVMSQIKNSENLKQLKRSLDELDQKINHSVMDMLEDEKNQLDLKIDASRFAYIVSHKEHYDQLENRFDNINNFMEERIDGVRKYAEKLLVIQFQKNQLAGNLIDSIKDCISIDGAPFQQVPSMYRGDSAYVKKVSSFPFATGSTTQKAKLNPEENKTANDNHYAAVSEFPAFQSQSPNVQKQTASNPPESAIQVKNNEAGKQSTTGKQKIASMNNQIKQVIEDNLMAIETTQKEIKQKNAENSGLSEEKKDSNQQMQVDQSNEQKQQASAQDESEENDEPLEHFYTVNKKTNWILKQSFFNMDKPVPVIQITHVQRQHRLVLTHAGRLFVLSGQLPSSQNRDPQAMKMTSMVKELIIDETTKQAKLVDKKPMLLARSGFGCLVDNYDKQLYVVGGSIENQAASSKCEVYDLKQDKWSELPNLNMARFSMSLVIFNDTYLYAFGGNGGESMKITDNIERLNLENISAGWESLSLKLPYPLANAGSYQVKSNQMLIFGGFNGKKQNKSYVLQEVEEKGQAKLLWKDSEQSDLKNPDIFGSCGCFYSVNDENNTIIFAGQDQLHEMNMEQLQFNTIRKIEQQPQQQ